MTASQSFRTYEVLQKHFDNDADAKLVVQEIEEIVEKKIEEKKSILLTKDDKVDLVDRIHRSKVETIIWIVGVVVIQFVLSYLLKK